MNKIQQAKEILDKVLMFIENHPGWTLYPGQDIHGYILQAHDLLEKVESENDKDNCV